VNEMAESEYFAADDFRAGLTKRGRLAFDTAMRNIDSAENQGDFLEAAMRYAEAVDMLELAKRAWIEAGRPMIMERGSGGVAEHPMMVAIARWHNEVAKAGRALRLEPREASKNAKPGRPVGATSSPDRGAPPVVKLARKQAK
jgi:hypothetical protein